MTYKEKNEGARYIVTVVGHKGTSKQYRIWDREEKKNIGKTYTNKRACQDVIDDTITNWEEFTQ